MLGAYMTYMPIYIWIDLNRRSLLFTSLFHEICDLAIGLVCKNFMYSLCSMFTFLFYSYRHQCRSVSTQKMLAVL